MLAAKFNDALLKIVPSLIKSLVAIKFASAPDIKLPALLSELLKQPCISRAWSASILLNRVVYSATAFILLQLNLIAALLTIVPNLLIKSLVAFKFASAPDIKLPALLSAKPCISRAWLASILPELFI